MERKVREREGGGVSGERFRGGLKEKAMRKEVGWRRRVGEEIGRIGKIDRRKKL